MSTTFTKIEEGILEILKDHSFEWINGDEIRNLLSDSGNECNDADFHNAIIELKLKDKIVHCNMYMIKEGE